MRRFLLASVAALAAVSAAPFASAQTLKVVMHSDLKVLDPIWSGAYIVRNHGYMLYDTLFAMDEQFQIKPQMVDTWSIERRRAHLDLQAARRAGMARRHAGHRRGLHRLAEALGGARFDGPEALAVAAGLQGRRSQDLPDGVQGEVRAGARIARQALRRRALHDAQARRRDRPLQADRGLHRLRPVHLQEGRMEARREDGLSQEHQVQAAARAGVGPGRRQGGQPRSRRMGVDPGQRDPGQRPAQGRDRHDRERQLRHAAGAGEGQERARHQRAAPPTSTCSA